MGPTPPAAEQAQWRALTGVFGRADISVEQLWLRYFALGGQAGPVELEAHLQGLVFLPGLQADMVAQAINERLDELAWTSRVPYLRAAREAKPVSGPLVALLDVFNGGYPAGPQRMAAAAEAAGRALGVQLVIYLVDDGQRLLVPLPSVAAPLRESLPVDSTPGGQAFRTGDATPDVGPPPRLWVLLHAGPARLGAVEVTLAAPQDRLDPRLRQQCEWLCGLLGNLINAHDPDGVREITRRRGHSSPAAELLAALAPPPSAGTDAFELAGFTAPGENVAGDIFDYALTDTTASLAIFDGTGPGPRAGLVSAAAVAAYRSVRRSGAELTEQAAAVDDTVATVDRGVALSGILAELHLATGQLGYLTAGAANLRLARNGEVIKMLAGGHRPPFGHGAATPAIGEDTLHPGDWLVLHTDGVTRARDAAGVPFGEDRLADALAELQVAAANPLPEAVRLLLRTVLGYQHGEPSDDATILIANWLGGPGKPLPQ